MWDMYGLECLFDVDEAMADLEQWEKEKVVSILKEETHPPKPSGIPINLLILRAKVNSQRQYEIYEFISSMTEKEIRNTFNTDPQIIVDWIRKNGYKVYSDYVSDLKQVIK